MPHTSRKRRNEQNAIKKRTEVTSEDGWTHIVGSSAKLNASSLTEKPGHHTTGPAPTYLTLQDLRLANAKAKVAWDASQSCRELRAQVRSILKNIENVNITKCLCLGLGSLSAPNFEWRRTSMWQLTAFLTIVEGLSGMGQDIQLLAQDPVFNDIDIAFLLELGIRVLTDPEAFQMMDSSSFMFCAHLVMDLSVKALQHGPVSILVDHDFDKIRLGTGTWTLNASIEELQLLEQFTREHDSMLLPQADSKMTGLYALRFYWRKRREDETRPTVENQT